jgi:hypothetical protein
MATASPPPTQTVPVTPAQKTATPSTQESPKSSRAEQADDKTTPTRPAVRDREKVADAAPPSKLPAPSSMTDSRYGSSLAPDEARSFIDEWFRVSSAARSPDDVLRFYAPQVKYYDRGIVSRSYIKHDKQYYFNRWPVRQSKITGPLNVADATASDKTVSFMLWYHLEDRRQQSKEGTTPVRLVLGKRDGRVVIVGEGN